ncbi:MAG: PAS domain S-box protein, partial [Chloroflexia bacterium]|nr:PAS domain S-box protein [Chloroflexia bacterium]
MVDNRSGAPTAARIGIETPPPGVAGITALIDAIPQPVWTARLDGSVDYVNPAWQSFTGVSGEAAQGHGWTVTVHPGDLQTIETALRAAAGTGEAFDIEYRMRRADGVYRWHLTRVGPFRAVDTRNLPAIAWVGTGFDIHDRRLAGEALRASEARYRDVVDHANDIVYTLRLDGTVEAVNPAIERMLGYRPDELVGRSIDPIIAPEDVARAHEMARQRGGDAGQRSYEIDLIAKDGRRVAVEINSRPVVSAGLPVLIHGIVRDISPRRERTQQADLMAAIGNALTSTYHLDVQLGRCADAIVTHLDAALARIWTLDPNDP